MSRGSGVLIWGFLAGLLLAAASATAQIVGQVADQPAARLRQALATYQVLAARPWPVIPEGPVIRPGDVDERLPALAERLQAEGDLPAPPAEARLLSPDLIEALKRFQARHGLAPDGIVGPSTLDALNVPAAARIAQIQANLIRWQGVKPPPAKGLYIQVNLAAAELEAYMDGVLMMRMRTIVGKKSTPTPQMTKAIARIIINPVWNVPVKIAAKEILPHVRRNPSYLEDNDIVIAGRGDDPYGAKVNWARVPENGMFTLKQLPGPHNALGTLKFDMPNKDDIYLHDTPNHSLFNRANRALSHGCVRLERPEDLALLILNAAENSKGWDQDSLQGEVAKGQTEIVPLPRPVPVTLTYFTAFADPDGTVQFRGDLYDLDGPFLDALTKSQPQSGSQEDKEDCQLCN